MMPRSSSDSRRDSQRADHEDLASKWKTDLIYTPDYNPQPNYRRKLNKPTNDTEKKIVWFFANDKVFYQDNEVGEIIANYLVWFNRN
jgi:hypothetical protein